MYLSNHQVVHAVHCASDLLFLFAPSISRVDLCLIFEKCLRKIDYYIVDLTPTIQTDKVIQVEASDIMSQHLSTEVTPIVDFLTRG